MTTSLNHAAQEALLALAVLKITDSEKPYIEISPTLRKQIYKAHDLLLNALTGDTDL